MPHIITDSEYRELTAYRASGLTPEKVMDLVAEEDAPLPLPLWAENMLEADAERWHNPSSIALQDQVNTEKRGNHEDQ